MFPIYPRLIYIFIWRKVYFIFINILKEFIHLFVFWSDLIVFSFIIFYTVNVAIYETAVHNYLYTDWSSRHVRYVEPTQILDLLYGYCSKYNGYLVVINIMTDTT